MRISCGHPRKPETSCDLIYVRLGRRNVCMFTPLFFARIYLNNARAHCPRYVPLTSQSPHVLLPKTEPFFQGYELLNPAEFSEFFHPASASLAPIAQSKPTFFGPD